MPNFVVVVVYEMSCFEVCAIFVDRIINSGRAATNPSTTAYNIVSTSVSIVLS